VTIDGRISIKLTLVAPDLFNFFAHIILIAHQLPHDIGESFFREVEKQLEVSHADVDVNWTDAFGMLHFGSHSGRDLESRELWTQLASTHHAALSTMFQTAQEPNSPAAAYESPRLSVQ
jgi:hypothetical protein